MNDLSIIEQVMLKGNLAVLSPQQKVDYYAKVCETVGLNPATKPFDYIVLNGKEVLYANKGCAEQLRNIHKISIRIVSKEKIDDVYVVTAEAVGKDGRCDSATGAVTVAGMKGDALANAFMKCETKAKRRVTLSICGLNMLDDSEVETIPGEAKKEVKWANETKAIPDNRSQKHDQVNEQPITSDKINEVTRDTGKHINGTASQLDGTVQRNNENASAHSYVATFGKFKGKTLDSFTPEEVDGYITWIKESAEKEGKPIKAHGIELIQNAEKYLQESGYYKQ